MRALVLNMVRNINRRVSTTDPYQVNANDIEIYSRAMMNIMQALRTWEDMNIPGTPVKREE